MSTIGKRLFFFGLLVALLTGCATAQAATAAPSPTTAISLGNDQFAPQPGDNALVGDTVEFVSAGVIKAGSSPAQVELNVAYRLPTPCHQLRVIISPGGSNGRINIKMYSLMKPNTPCALMALATPMQATLSLGSLPAGHYTVWVNDVKAAEFDA